VRYSVTGRVIGDTPAQEGERFWLSLIEPGKNGESRYIDRTKETDHSFHFSRIPAGEFPLQLSSAYGPEPMTWSGPICLYLTNGRVAMARKLAVSLYWMWRKGFDYPQTLQFGSHAGKPVYVHGVK
jgi:hypothetical protein